VAVRSLLVLALLLGAGGVVSFLAAAYNQHGGRLVVDSAVKSFGEAPPRTSVKVTFALTNQSTRAVKIFGATPVCNLHGCLDLDNLPLDIPAKSRRDLAVLATMKEPGAFSGEFTLFSDHPDQPEVALTVSGRVVGVERLRSSDTGEKAERWGKSLRQPRGLAWAERLLAAELSVRSSVVSTRTSTFVRFAFANSSIQEGRNVENY
jgi:hypothetical protein